MMFPIIRHDCPNKREYDKAVCTQDIWKEPGNDHLVWTEFLEPVTERHLTVNKNLNSQPSSYGVFNWNQTMKYTEQDP